MNKILWFLLLLPVCNAVIITKEPCSNVTIIRTPETVQIGEAIQHFEESDSISVISTTSAFSENYLYLENNSLVLNKSIDLDVSETCNPIIEDIGINCNGGTKSIYWIVDAVDEHHPHFPNSSIEEKLYENYPMNMEFIVLSESVYGAVDADCNSQPPRYNFSMNGHREFQQSGDTMHGGIMLVKQLDYELETSYTVKAFAWNAVALSDPLIINVIVHDVDDMDPYFTHDVFYLNVTEGDRAVVGTPQTTSPPVQAFDGDIGINDTIEYELIDNPFPTVFSVVMDTGMIIVKEVLDADGSSSWKQCELRVKAYQTNKPTTRTAFATVIVNLIDINDNIPKFKETIYKAAVAEHSMAGTVVAQVSATDADEGINAEFEYIMLNNAEQMFDINPKTGQVTVNSSEALDREKIGNKISIQIGTKQMQNGVYGENTTLEITVLDINDNSPKFSQPAYSFQILESDSTVGNVYANDSDEAENGRVSYTLQGIGSDHFPFAIDAGEIQVSTTEPPAVDKTYFGLAEACDNPAIISSRRCTYASVTITVSASNRTDFNEYAPVVVNVTENTPPGIIYNFDFLGEDFTCTLLSCIDKFEISDRLLKTKKSLDYEDVPKYASEVTVNQGSQVRGNFSLTVNILDVNDNAPEFKNSSFSFKIPNSAAIGHELGFIRATDRDREANGRIFYSIPEDGKSVILNESSGLLTLRRYPQFSTCLPYETVPVMASDGGNPPLKTSSTVMLHPETLDGTSVIVVLSEPTAIDTEAIAKNISLVLDHVEVKIEKVTRPDLLSAVKRTHLHVTATRDGNKVSQQNLNQMILKSCDKLETLGLVAGLEQNRDGGELEMKVTAIALIAIAGVVLLGSLAAIYLVCRRYKWYERQESLNEKLTKRSDIYETQEIKLDIEDDVSEFGKLDTVPLTLIQDETNVGVLNPGFDGQIDPITPEAADQGADIQPIPTTVDQNTDLESVPEPTTAEISDRELSSSISEASDGNCNINRHEDGLDDEEPALDTSQSDCLEPDPDYSPQKVRFTEAVVIQENKDDVAPEVVNRTDDNETLKEPVYENVEDVGENCDREASPRESQKNTENIEEKGDSEINPPNDYMNISGEDGTFYDNGVTVTPL